MSALLKRLFLCSVILSICLFPPVSFLAAEDYEVPHRFKPGDVISAEMMNEVFEVLARITHGVRIEDLLGDWSCTYQSGYRDWDTLVVGGNVGFETDNDKLIMWRTDKVTFMDDGDGTYSYKTEKYNMFYVDTTNCFHDRMNSPDQQRFAIKNNRFYTSGCGGIPFRVMRFSENTYEFSNNYVCITCSKINRVPATPDDLSAEVAGLKVTLRWTDLSDNETGFRVFRRGSIDAPFSEIAAPAANVTTFEETLATPGIYWYRVNAANENGDSLGSNVVKVEIKSN